MLLWTVYNTTVLSSNYLALEDKKNVAEFPWKQHERVGSFFLDIVLMSPPHQHMAALLLQFTEVYAARNVSERWRSLIRRKHGFSWLTWSFRDGCFQRDGRALFFPFALLRFSRFCCLYLPAGYPPPLNYDDWRVDWHVDGPFLFLCKKKLL